LRALSADLTVAEETERRRIAAGLHDDLNQMLIAAKIKLAKLSAPTDAATVHTVIADVERCIDDVLSTSRSLVFDLVSPVLQKLGLEAALEDLCERMEKQHGLSFRFGREGPSARLSDETEIILFHAVRELLRNTVRHAEAQNVNVTFRRAGDMVTIAVQDDGRGIGKEAVAEHLTPTGGFGLFAIHERMGFLGGSIDIQAGQPRGVRIVLTVPLEKKEKIR